MADAEPRHVARKRAATGLPLPDNVALVLQGGGALGAFQVGVYEALDAARIEVDWVAGISIGAINAAIIAGNPCERRMERLHKFWDRATGFMPSFPLLTGDFGREMLHELSAAAVGLFGVPGMFKPRFIPPFLAPSGSIDAMSFYESGPLAETLDELVDWDLLNDGPIRLSVGAVEMESGNFRFFDSKRERIDKRHIMASGALPPGLPPVEIDGKLWWDGGLVSNTPLSWIVDKQDSDLLVFQVDLFSSAHERPKNIMDVMSRQKEIQFSSRTRQISNMLVRQRREREMMARLLDKLPPELAGDPDAEALRALTRQSSLSLVQLIYRANAWEGGSRDYEFSARTMNEHIEAGRQAIAETMTKSEVIAQNIYDGTSAAFDLIHR